jgi:CMP-N,N'-diacetyllegionaminic acid synthase
MARVLGLIPAKGGSRRFPRKNVQKLAGKPLIQWAAEAAWESGAIDRLVLSTDDEEIAGLAADIGIEVPFRRPPNLGRDPAEVEDVALHALDEMEALGDSVAVLVILLPTCPLRIGSDVREAVDLFDSAGGKFLMSVSECEHTPFTSLNLTPDGLLEPFFPEYVQLPSLQIPTAYRPNGAIHVLDVAAFRVTRSYYSQPLIAYVMPRERSVDIDEIEDLRYAEFLLS